MMLIVCILVTRLHAAGYDDLPRMMLARSSWSLATRRTRRLHGAEELQHPTSSLNVAIDHGQRLDSYIGLNLLQPKGNGSLVRL